MTKRACWCGNEKFKDFSSEYARCVACGTLVELIALSDEALEVKNDDADFYGKKYWLEHQSKDFGYPNIFQRAKKDLTDRNLHWLKTLLKFKAPPSKVLELGCSHGSFVALLRQAGFDASGMEMSPWVVEFAQETFNIPMLVGPVENIELEAGTFDVIALMDVLEHLPDPVGTMSHALKLLKPDGILIIQTPQANDDMTYPALLESNSPFLEQFKADEHIYLFTQNSVAALFKKIGAKFIQFEPPIFHQYDMFFVVSRQPIEMISEEDAEKSIETPKGRFVQALLDQDKQIKSIEEHVKTIDADRAARLDQIHALTNMIHELQAAAGK
ncbi:class I SAM-dependent methyltransferase [Rhizobium skierniewicense]|uniref:class I SAM-dependent methyltransferase n=1 Tax=Rhizobium skierniewicense TaxID=984260 RepID=UPI001573ED2B|nr:class I SAM-dependent methyltransferase [Rhizobium skierniewicense]NTF33469.1 class I SAM-dependent methyltransferase [Rhizobium skierniewicense]